MKISTSSHTLHVKFYANVREYSKQIGVKMSHFMQMKKGAIKLYEHKELDHDPNPLLFLHEFNIKKRSKSFKIKKNRHLMSKNMFTRV